MSNLSEAASVPGPSTVYQMTITTVAVYIIPPEFIGGWVRLSTHDASIQYKFASTAAAATVTEDQASAETDGDGSTGDPFLLTANAATGERLEAGTSTDFVIDANWTHFGIVAEDSGTAEVTLRSATASQ